jgi:hypothetical protein
MTLKIVIPGREIDYLTLDHGRVVITPADAKSRSIQAAINPVLRINIYPGGLLLLKPLPDKKRDNIVRLMIVC